MLQITNVSFIHKIQLLRDFPGAIISVSHDRKYISQVADTVYRLTPKGLERLDCHSERIL